MKDLIEIATTDRVRVCIRGDEIVTLNRKYDIEAVNSICVTNKLHVAIGVNIELYIKAIKYINENIEIVSADKNNYNVYIDKRSKLIDTVRVATIICNDNIIKGIKYNFDTITQLEFIIKNSDKTQRLKVKKNANIEDIKLVLADNFKLVPDKLELYIRDIHSITFMYLYKKEVTSYTLMETNEKSNYYMIESIISESI